MREDGRAFDELRAVKFTTGYQDFPTGSCLVEIGKTRVLCAATIDAKVPRWMHGRGKGWVTAEYSMLPGATNTRSQREVSRGKPGGRTVEIQRLIGRSLRAAVDMKALGERTIWVDCDVLQADGGTRTASVTGGFVAMALAMQKLVDRGSLPALPLRDTVSAISVGVVNGANCLDLPYSEDSRAEVDANFVITGRGDLVEVQGTAEGEPFPRQTLDELIDLAILGCGRLLTLQQAAMPGVDLAAIVGERD